MVLLKHELKQNLKSFVIWTIALSLTVIMLVGLYPSMKSQMDEFTEMFSQMGSFSSAFGMDKVSFGTFTGYYSVEVNSSLGLTGAIFAALTGGTILSKEESNKTSEFLLSHPVSRKDVVTSKLLCVLIEIIAINIIIWISLIVSVILIGESVDFKLLSLLHLAVLLNQLIIGLIAFFISSFQVKGSIPLSIGLAMFFYFLNIISNITDTLDFVKYLTPYSISEGADIINKEAINYKYLISGFIYSALSIYLSYKIYLNKDIK